VTAPIQYNLLDTAIKMLEQYTFCDRCLGRQFAWLSTDTSNSDRGFSLKMTLSMMADDDLKSGDHDKGERVIGLLASHGQFRPAQTIAEKNGIDYEKGDSCHLCTIEGQSVFDRIQDISQRAVALIKDVEFDNFLVGTIPVPILDERQDEIRAKFSLLHAEVVKSDFSRELGKSIHEVIKKDVEFERPHLVFLYDMVQDELQLQINPVFIYGRYQKLVRGIPQSRWDCKECKGKGCEECNGTGRRYPDSISEYVGTVAQQSLKGTRFKFHAAGREDVDVLMLGDGRPFVVEISEPRIRTPDLLSLEKQINRESKKRIKVSYLKMSDREQSQRLKENASKNIKEYSAVIVTENPTQADQLRRVEAELSGREIAQRTPVRVAHRRSDLVRKKMVYEVKLKKKKDNSIEAFLKVQGGTYVKELISGDDGRTEPSIAGILGLSCVCKKLDVTAVYSSN
jgi:tRNA pseudouridine synthase 10